MPPRWDRMTPRQSASVADAALRAQVGRLARFQPWWRESVRGAGVRARDVRSVEDLTRVPPVGERDLCPDGDPVGAARMVLQAGESGFAAAVDAARFRRGAAQRLFAPARSTRTVDAAVRPVAYHLGGLALGLPIASTRDDLDLVARAGARMWAVLGLTRADVLVSTAPTASTLAGFALPYAAIGAGAPAVHVDLAGAVDALECLPATVVAVPDAAALDALLDRRGDRLPATVRTVLVTGDPDGVAALAPDARVLRVWGPGEARWLWAECRPGSGLHAYPDLEVLETLDPAGTDRAEGGELVVTQLGLAGSALPRWRTGALVGASQTTACPGCGRTVPRVMDVRPAALVAPAEVAGRRTVLDLRAVAAALAGRSDVAGWALSYGRSPAGEPSVVVRVAARGGRGADAAIGAYADIEAAAGSGPTQVVLDPEVAGRADLALSAPA